MAQTCLSYLNSQQVKTLSTCPSPDLQGTPFLEYSSVYWGVYVKRDLSECAKLLALKLFNDYNNHISTRTLLKTQKGYSYPINFDKSYPFSGLHCASLFGIVELVIELIELEGCDINQRDCVDNTSLACAARNGHERVVEMLLKQGNVGPTYRIRTAKHHSMLPFGMGTYPRPAEIKRWLDKKSEEEVTMWEGITGEEPS